MKPRNDRSCLESGWTGHFFFTASYGKAVSAYYFTQKLRFSFEELAFFRFKFQIMFTQTEEDCTKDFKIKSNVSSKYNYVIQVHNDCLPGKTPEDQLHCPLKCCWRDAQSHGYASPLEAVRARTEWSLRRDFSQRKFGSIRSTNQGHRTAFLPYRKSSQSSIKGRI